MLDWRAYTPATIMLAGCVMIFGVHQQKSVPLRSSLTALPATYEQYRSKDQVVSDDERRVAGMSDYVMRVFQKDSLNGFSVYVGYYDMQTQGHTAHSPKNCLPGAGWEPLGSRAIPIRTADGVTHQVNRYLLVKGPAVALVYYWYQGRGRVAWDEYQVKWDLLRDAAVDGRTEEALVRIVIPVQPGESGSLEERAVPYDSLATSVARAFIPAVFKALPTPAT